MGARRLLESWEDSLSHVLRVSEREAVPVDSFSRVADRIFERHVEKIAGRAVSHAPAAIHAARGGGQVRRRRRSGSRRKIGCARPEGLRLTEGMFVAHVEGRSMEPRIPDGSLNIFRGPVVGSRQGKIVLVELIGVHERFTVKRYTSKKSSAAKTNGSTSASGWSRSIPSTKPST